MVLASVVMVAWVEGSGAINVGIDHHPTLVYLLSGSVVSFFALIGTGISLILHRQTKWGWIALAFASYTFVFLLLCLPALAKQRF